MKLKRVFRYFRIIFGLSLLALLLYKIPFGQTIQALKDASVTLVFTAILLIGTAILISAFKLQILTRLKSEKIALWLAIRAYYIGLFFNNFMPTDIGGDIFKINELKKNGLELQNATQAVIIERVTGISALIIMALFLAMPGIGMFARFGMAWLQTFFLISILILSVGLVIAYTIWKGFFKSYLKPDNLKVLFQALVISLIYHFLRAVILLILTASVGNTLPYTSLLIAVPIVSFVSLLPVSIGALGIKEGALVFCLTKAGLGTPEALAVALLLRASFYIHSLIGGLLYSARKEA